MSVTRGFVAGFGFGMVLAVGISRIKFRTQNVPWLLRIVEESEKKERVSKKEAVTLLNDQAEDIAILRALVLEDDPAKLRPFYRRIQIKALTDPWWQKLLDEAD